MLIFNIILKLCRGFLKCNSVRLILTDILFASLQCNWQELKFIPQPVWGLTLLLSWKVLQTWQNQMMKQWRTFESLSYMFAFLPLMGLQKERPRWHIIYMGKLEIRVVESFNVSLHSVWEASDNMGCDLRRYHFSALFSLFSWFVHTCPHHTCPHHIKFYSFRAAQDLGCLLFIYLPTFSEI